MKMQNTDEVSIAQTVYVLRNSLQNVKSSHIAKGGTEEMGPWEALLAASIKHTHIHILNENKSNY